MSSYCTFAQFYDRLTENVDYEVRSDYISNFFYDYNNGNSLLDLACGTGTLSRLFADKGYSVTGLDLSEDMLCVASQKSSSHIKYIKADMCDFNLLEKVDFCVCSLDSINHLADICDVKKCFEQVANNIKCGGIFVFDLNTIYKHKHILADNTFVFDEDDFFLSWDNEYIGENSVRILLDFFVFNGKNYDRYSEEFFEKAYSVDEIKSLLNDFEITGVYDDMTLNPPNDKSERIYFVCRRKEY
ncbi:MAG: class I SAM-dependent DNA methyltransferase [Eubacterium sp.]